MSPLGSRGKRSPTPAQADADQLAVRHFIERLALVLAAMGFPLMPARVWATLMIENDETSTAGEIGEQLGVSPAAVSGAVRYLLQVGLITRVARPGSRRQHYSANGDLAQTFLARQAGLVEFSKVAAEGVDLLGPETPGGVRVAEVRDFFDFIARATPSLVDAWKAHRSELE